GGLGDFPDARVHVLALEHQGATQRSTRMEARRYRPAQWAHDPVFETYAPAGEPWKGFACVRELRGLPPEILLVPRVGHTRGHTAVAIDVGDEWLMHAGDAYFHAAQMDRERPSCPPLLSVFERLVAFDPASFYANHARLRELAIDPTSNVRVFSAH